MSELHYEIDIAIRAFIPPRETLKKSDLKLDNAIFRCYDMGITP